MTTWKEKRKTTSLYGKRKIDRAFFYILDAIILLLFLFLSLSRSLFWESCQIVVDDDIGHFIVLQWRMMEVNVIKQWSRLFGRGLVPP